MKSIKWTHKSLLIFSLALLLSNSVGCDFSGEENVPIPSEESDAGIVSSTDAGGTDDLDDVDENGIPKQFTALSELVRKINSARDGNPVDMDGDGYPELTVETDENGVKTVTMDKYGDVYFMSESKPGEYVHTLQDTNGDGITDIQWDRTASPSQEVWQYDRDYDGYPEEIKTITYDFDNQKVHVRNQRDLDGDGNYEYDETQTGDAPELVKDEPDKAKVIKATTKHLQIKISALDCADDEEGIKRAHGVLYAALNCAIGDGLNCLRNTNRSMYDSAMQYLSSGETLILGCKNNIKNGAHAETNKMKFDWLDSTIFFKPGPFFINCDTYNWKECFELREPYFCNIMLHEFLHAVGYGFTPTHDDGVDEVYSCGRYCGHCSNDLFNAPGFPNRDCARCGGTLEEKMQCGHVEKIRQEPCSDIYNVCHAGLGCIADACEECTTIYGYTCAEEIADDLSYPESVYTINNFICCNACPADCNASNDFTCSIIDAEDTCHQPLPMCRQK